MSLFNSVLKDATILRVSALKYLSVDREINFL